MRVFITAIMVSLFALPATIKAQNIYPAAGDVSILGYSPLLILQRNTADGGFIQGVQTRLNDGTNSWYFGALHKDQWIVSKGDFLNPKLIVTENGNVGIGTTTPANLGDYNALTFNGVKGSFSEYRISEVNYFRIGADYGSGFIWAQSNSYLRFGTNATERMRIDVNGNVGIGTTAPDSKLTVKGTIHAEEVKVDLNIPAADYVFEPDYALMPLSEVKQFVEEKKHLPGIPSGKDMEANGINVSEMNMLLLKKVEELTLHIIRQEKEIEELKSQFKTIQKQ